MLSSLAAKALKNHYVRLQKERHDDFASFYLRPESPDNLFVWEVVFFPSPPSIYAGATFRVRLTANDNFPFESPKIEIVTPMPLPFYSLNWPPPNENPPQVFNALSRPFKGPLNVHPDDWMPGFNMATFAKALYVTLFLTKDNFIHCHTGGVVWKQITDPALFEAEVRQWVRTECQIPQIAQTFALVVLLADDFVRITETEPEPLPQNVAKPEDKLEAQRRSRAQRFFHIMRQLPLELQMITCNRVYGSVGSLVLTKESEPAFKMMMKLVCTQ